MNQHTPQRQFGTYNYSCSSFCTKKIPTEVFLGYEKKKVVEYIPKVNICFKCRRFGHSSMDLRLLSTHFYYFYKYLAFYCTDDLMDL